MTDEELKQQFQELYECVELLMKSCADQKILTLRMMAYQHAHLAAIRDMLVRMGADRTMLSQQLRSSYQTAVNLFHDQLEDYQQTGDVKKLLDSLTFPDETLGN